MKGSHLAHACIALAGAMAFAAPALPQDVTAPCQLCSPDERLAEEKPAKPVTLDVEAKLDFDRLILAGAGDGSAELGADGSRRVSGSVTAISARAMVGEVAIRGEPGRQVRVDLPGSIELYGFNGGTIRVESIRSDLPAAPRLDSNGRLSFRFGGIVRLSGNSDGEFRGDARINVEYF
ncbi:MAG: DUF4402 domain-containing protein [Sphingomicrobium sp.]